MFNLTEYKKHPDQLADLLPWAALIAPGVILNKDGSLQQTLRFRGPDLASATDTQLVTVSARLNNALKRLGSGWAIYIEANRRPYTFSKNDSAFPDPISWLIDAERNESFMQADASFESDYYITLQYLPPSQSHKKMSRWFITKTDDDTKEDSHEVRDYFTATVTRILHLLQDVCYEAEALSDDETLTYLHQAISCKNHPVKTPENPMYLDAFLADTPLLAGLAPKLGEEHLGVLSVLSFPSSTLPALLDQLNHLPMRYRWVTRFMPLDKIDAEKTLKRYRQRWFAKRKGMLQLLQEVFTKTESQLTDSSAIQKSRDVDEALQELADDQVTFGYYTTTITVRGKSQAEVDTQLQLLERVINGLGFTTIIETYNAVEAWLSSLPGQAYANVRKPLLNTLNLAHLMPLSAVWSGPKRDDHLQAPPLMTVHSEGRTPFRLVNHIGDVGHTFIVGPTGAGKSVLLTLMAMQFRRYTNANIFIFDKGGSFLASTWGVNGAHFELGKTDDTPMAFQPLRHIDDKSTCLWAQEWLLGLIAHENITITPKEKQAIWEALQALTAMPATQRTLTGLVALLQHQALRQALQAYTLSGAYGYLFDADHETTVDNHWQCFEMETLMQTPNIVAPTLSYLFHRVEKQLTGEPTLLVLDEAWLFLDHPIFADKIREWLKTLRKHNVSVVFATQSVDDALESSLASTLLEACPARIFLPNDRTLEPAVRAHYAELGLNERELNNLAHATPKRQYYYQSRLGNRLFDVELGVVAQAFCAATSKTAQHAVRAAHEQDDYQQFLQRYLTQQDLAWVWESIVE
ncbi:MAG: conjugal transfer protein TrbE [marine bacterium B5-7]|nr:MAG: conjugal transfer protein TrbE [marine bacterium B5-7]